MRKSKAPAGDIVLLLVFALFFLFAPFRELRVLALFFFLVHGLSFFSALLLPRAISARRLDTILRVNRMQQVNVTIELRNRWPFPVRSVMISDRLGGLFSNEPPVFVVSLRPRERRLLSWTADARDRGEFTIGPLDMEGPGPFALRRWRATQDALVTVIVYPAVFALTLDHKRGLPAGNIAVLNRLYEDVSRFRSLREYTPGDELRRINWKVSARLGKLHTTEYLPSLYFPVLVLLNLTAPDYPLTMRYHIIERAVEVAASLVVYFAGMKQEVGLVASARIPGEPGYLTVPVRPGNSHGVRILEALARARPCDEEADFVNVIHGAMAAGGIVPRTGTRVLAVTPPLSRERRGALRGLTRRGWQLEAFFVGAPHQRADEQLLTGVMTHTVNAGEEAALDA